MNIASKLAALTAAIVMTFASTVSASADHQRQNNDGAVIVGTALAIIGLAIAHTERGERDYGHRVHGYYPPSHGGWHQAPPRNYHVLRQPPPQHFGHPAPRRGNALPPLRRVIDRTGKTGFVAPNGVPCGAYGLYGMPSFTRGSTFMRTICYH